MKPTILYVDDEHHNLVAFKASFRRHYKVLTAISGEDALDVLASEEVEVIISDQRMPGMTGVELFSKIQELYPLPIRMVLTAYSDVADIIDAINKGKVYYYVTKPWKLEDLKVLMDNALEAFRLKVENQSLTLEKQQLELEAAQMEKERILAQFETLKNQVNPHFLFNSLNVLSSLVHEDPDLAESFIVKLTRIYRYVLDLSEERLVSLEKELNFANSYFFLQQIRFGNNLQLYIQVPEIKKQHLIPPLSLQLLMENAVKHNVISKEKPLTIELFLEDEELVVKNNFQPRTESIHSTGIGLNNLRERYRLLTEKRPRFEQLDEDYVARIPLLSPKKSH